MSMTQDSLVAKSAQLQSHVNELLGIVGGAIDQQLPIHEVESKTLQVLLQMGRSTLQILFDELGSGDVGESVEVDEGRILKREQETHSREYTSIFGTFQLDRYVYTKRKGAKIELVPLDARLALPESKFSYLLQDWDQSICMEEPFEKVAKVVHKILGLDQHVDSLERMNRHMAESVDDFHMQQSAPPPGEEGAIFVQTADGKGVPIRRADDAAKIESHRSKSGPKPGAKRMATLGSVYSIDPYVRTPEQIVEALFCQPSKLSNDNGEKSRRPRVRRQLVRPSERQLERPS